MTDLPQTPDTDPSGGPPAPGDVSLRTIEKRSILLAAALVVGSLIFRSAKVSLGVALGGGLAFLNYWWLKRFVETIFLNRRGKVDKLTVALYLFKYVLIGFAIYAVIRYRLVDIFGLLAGLLVVIMAITLEGVLKSIHPGKEKDNDGAV
jgi:hypothetical protein